MAVEEVSGISKGDEGVVDGAGSGNNPNHGGEHRQEYLGPAQGVAQHGRIIQLPAFAQQLIDRFGAVWVGAVLIALLGLALKLVLLGGGSFPFNSDEAVVALMARHILAGRWPAFFYGQAYMGSLDATLVAAAFSAFGQSVWAIRLVQATLYFATVLTTAGLGWSIFRNASVSLVAALLMAIPVVNVTLYTTISLGGYGEALLIGNLLLLLAMSVWKDDRGYALWGFLAGLGFWAFGITLVFSLPSGVLILLKLRRNEDLRRSAGRVALMIATFGLGALPWLAGALGQGLSPFVGELFGEAIAGASPSNFVSAAGQHLVNLLLFGPTIVSGVRPPWAVEWLAMPLAPLALVFWLVTMVFGISRLRVKDEARVGRWMLAGVVGALVMGFILTPFGADPTGRYFLPLAVPLALMAGEMVGGLLVNRIGYWAYGAVALILVFNLASNFQAAAKVPPGITTQFDPVAQVDHRYMPELIDFLQAESELAGYSNYWVSYPLAFLSEERLIFTPALPYHLDFRHSDRDDRYAPYRRVVDGSPSIAYITTNFEELDQRLRDGLARRGIEFRTTVIGPYTVFHGLSERVEPEQLGIYELP